MALWRVCVVCAPRVSARKLTAGECSATTVISTLSYPLSLPDALPICHK
eukprot:COSAG02_NODE_42914_length_380_cov_0.519573_1_plen_48_part_10